MSEDCNKAQLIKKHRLTKSKIVMAIILLSRIRIQWLRITIVK